MSGNGDLGAVNQPVPRRRRRPAKSCEPCRRRKVRCDQGQPCRPCRRARGSVECFYKDETAASIQFSGLRESRESLPFRACAPFSPPDSLGQRNTNARDAGDAWSTQKGHLDKRDSGSEAIDRHGGAESEPTQVGASHETDDATGPTLRLRNGASKVRLFGRSHWMYAAGILPAVIGNFDTKEVDFAIRNERGDTGDIARVFKDLRGHRVAIKSQLGIDIIAVPPDLLSSLPVRPVCDELISCYLRTLEPIYRIVHVPSFWKDYRLLWQDSDLADVSRVAPSSFMKLILIAAIGSTFYVEEGAEEIRRRAPRWIQAAQSWLTGPLEKSTMNLEGLQVFCLLIIAKQTTYIAPGPTWISTGSLLTAAMSMGLHRNPDMFPLLSPFQAEMRKRLWATTLELVVQSHVDSALPLMISHRDFDTPAPLNVDDDDLNPEDECAPMVNAEISDSSLQIHLYDLLEIRMDAARLLNGLHAEQSYQKVLSLGSRLREACRKTSSIFQRQSVERGGKSTTLTSFHQKFIDIILHKYILLLHRAFMMKSREEPQFYLARKICVESAMVMASYASERAATVQADDLFHLSAFGRGSFKGPFSLDVIIVLTLELFMQLQEQGERSSSSDRLDEMKKTARGLLMEPLETIAGQLFEMIKLGNPSLKSYNFLTALLGQIKAMEQGTCVQKEAHDSLQESLKACLKVLERHRSALPHQLHAEPGLGSSGAISSPPFSISGFDDFMDWDISKLLNIPELETA